MSEQLPTSLEIVELGDVSVRPFGFERFVFAKVRSPPSHVVSHGAEDAFGFVVGQ